MTSKSFSIRFLPYIVWFFGAIFFLVDYIVRVSPSVLTPTLMQTFHADAFTIGGFSGFFYYAYISMQIPVGILVDRFGPRRLLIVSTLVCALSTFMFAGMSNIIIGFVSRFLMGFGASFAFVGTLKLISLWFKAERFALLTGITQAMGMVGAMLGQGPMATLYQNFGWRGVTYGLAFFFVLLSLLIMLLVKDANPHLKHHDIAHHSSVKVGVSLKTILKNPYLWLNCFFIGLLYAPSACFGEQWGASFLSASQGISIAAAGHETGIMFIGLAVGCPILGWISDQLKRRLYIMRISVVICLLLLSIVIYGNFLPFHALLTPDIYTLILFIYGFFNGGIVVSYALSAEINRRQLTGMALGITNMASVIVGAIMIPIVGFILDHLWTGQSMNGIRIFAVSEYQIAFAALPIGFIIAFIISFFQKETYCQHFQEQTSWN